VEWQAVTASLGTNDAGAFQRMRMEDYFMNVPVFDAFDAMAHIPQTSCTEREP
jgi:erythromycin esterase